MRDEYDSGYDKGYDDARKIAEDELEKLQQTHDIVVSKYITNIDNLLHEIKYLKMEINTLRIENATITRPIQKST